MSEENRPPEDIKEDKAVFNDMGESDNSPASENGNNTFEEMSSPNFVRDLEALYDIPVQVSAVIGRAHMPVNQLLKLGRGAVVELDRQVGEAIDIFVNNRLVARGEVVVVDDRIGVTMTEILKSERS